MATMSSLTFDPPEEFIEEEMMTSWRVPYTPGLKDPRVLQPQLPVRPNLIVQRRKVDKGQDLPVIAAGVCGQLLDSIEGIGEIASAEITFQDGVIGLLLEFSFPAVGTYRIVQLHALRLDGEILTSMTLCTEMSRLTPEVHGRYRACLASASLDPAGKRE
jgi:hypothetical protein